MSNQKRIMMVKKLNIFKLKNLKQKKSFKVPEGYFEAFPERLQSRIHSEKENLLKKPFFLNFTVTQIALAASFIGLVIMTYSGIKFLVSNQQLNAEIQQTEISDLPDNDIYNLDETMVYDLYSETSTDNNNIYSVENNDTDELINYLLLEDSDIEVLIQEL
jgi:hypothetical protein